ncbi:MAG TPA: hypothetical protein VHA52_00825 [Candidatus Babeliaceae bacterium]|nr:hypothetical protein [Candidatus Babeliaceae bacterium]
MKQTLKPSLPTILYILIVLAGATLIVNIWEYSVFKKEAESLAHIKETYNYYIALLRKSVDIQENKELFNDITDENDDSYQKKKFF